VRAVVQRVRRARVVVQDSEVGAIGRGLLVLLGVASTDGESEARWLAHKVAGLRVFADEQDRMNLSARQVSGGVLVVSQFTLFGEVRRGFRPSFGAAADPEKAMELYERFCAFVEEEGLPVAKGRFRAMMDVELVNDGPVTILLDTQAGA
jgi:D-aminoacyl-tRNA deacylase